MARPAKAIDVATGARTKEEIQARQEMESALRGAGAPVCPDWLSDAQRAIFLEICTHYAEAGILSGLDYMSLSSFAVAVDRLHDIEIMVNEEPGLLMDSKLMTARKNYEATMWRGCSEFCLSPQARAKIGSLATAKAKEQSDPLLAVLAE